MGDAKENREKKLAARLLWRFAPLGFQTPIFPRGLFTILLDTEAPNEMVSVNYLFGRSLISSDFLKRIVTLKFRDMRNSMRNLMSVV